MLQLEKRWLERPIFRFSLTIAAVLAAFLLRQYLVLDLGVELPTFILFYPAVFFAAVRFGLRSGLTATFLSAVLVEYWFFPPVGQFKVASGSDIVALILFSAIGVFMSVVAERYRRYQRQVVLFEKELALLNTAEMLHKASETQRLAIEAAALGTWDYNLETGAIDWDETCRKGFGYETDTRVDYSAAFKRIHSEDQLAVDEAVKAAIGGANGGVYHIEFRVVWPDSSIHWLASHGRVYFDGEEGNRRATRFIGVNSEITTRKLSEGALQAGEERYRNLFDIMGEAFCIIEVLFDSDGKPEDYRFLEVNSVFERQTGLHDATGKRMRELAPAHEAHWFEIYGRIALTGEAAHFINQAKALDRWYDVHAYRVGEPELRRVAIIFNDISDYKRAEAALKENEERLRLALDAGSMATWDMDIAGGGLTWNDEMFRQLGYEPGSIPASNEAWKRRLFPEDAEKAEAALNESLDLGHDLLSEYRVLGMNDQVRWVEARGRSERDENGNAVRSFGVVIDNTGRKRAEEALRASEEQFRNLANAIPQLCWMANADGWIFWYNDRWYEYTAATPEDMEGWGWQSVLDPNFLPEVIERWKGSIATEQPFDMVFPLLGADGVFRPFLTRIVPIRNADGKLVRWFGTNTEIGEQKQIEAELRKSQARLNMALDVANLGEWERDLKARTASRSLRHAHIFGYESVESAWGLDRFLDHVLPEYRQEAAGLLRASHSGEPIDFETKIRRVDGEVRWLWVRSKTDMDDAGQPARAFGVVMDITARKQAEEAIRSSQEKLHGIVSSAMDAVISVDEDQRISVFNQAAETIFQCPATEAIGSTLDRFIPAFHRESHRDNIRQFGTESITSRSIVSPSILTAIRANGEEFPIEAAISRVEAAGQKLFTVILRDITERKRAEEQLQQLNRTLRALSNTTQALLRAADEPTFLNEVCGIVTEDCGHRMVWIGVAEDDEDKTVRPLAIAGHNDGYLQLARISWADNERGRGPCGSAIRSGQPSLCNDMLADPAFAPWREEAVKRGYASSLVIPLKEGNRIWGTITIYSGKPNAFSEGEVNLLTELADDLMFGMQTLRIRAARAFAEELARCLLTTIQAEKERLTALVNSIKDEVWFADTQMRFTLANPAARLEFGLSGSFGNVDIATFASTLDVLRANGTPRPLEDAPPLRALRGEVVKDELEIVRTRTNGELRYREVSSAPVNDAKGSIVGAVSVVRDVTARILAEQALLRSEKLASVGRMAAVIAHEINNPLAAVTNLLFLAQSATDLPEAARQYIEMADAELKRIAHITQQSLGFYRESNAPAIVAVTAILDSALDLMKSRIKARHAVIEKKLSGNLEISAIGGELRQVFSNLLLNSLDAIDEGGAISLRAKPCYDFKNGRRCVRVTVADNGRGIDLASRPHIFEPFFTTKGTVGTGLGLWVAKQIVDKHSGTIRMHSFINCERRGTVFTVVLPVDGVKDPSLKSI